MEEIENVLLRKLSSRGLAPVQIPRFVKDVVNIVSDGGEFTTGMINGKLETLGWDRGILDPFTLELILALLCSEGNYEMRSTRVH